MPTKEEQPQTRLVVVEPFAQYRRGDEITDSKAVKQALADHPANVVKAGA